MATSGKNINHRQGHRLLCFAGMSLSAAVFKCTIIMEAFDLNINFIHNAKFSLRMFFLI